MSSNPYAPLRIEPGSSFILRRSVVAACTGAVGSLWLTPLPLSLLFPVTLLTIAATARIWRERPELGGAGVRVEWNRQGEWFWYEGSRRLAADLLGDTYINAGLVILNFRTRDGRRSLVLPRDAVDPVTFRKLKVRLRIEAAGPEESLA